jgi:hypothetical protein
MRPLMAHIQFPALDAAGAIVQAAHMETRPEPREERVVLILADISGYTKFMVANQLSALHGQMVITTLIETILREVDIPLQLQEIEGDAIFLYAEHPGNDEAWQEALAQIRVKLGRFFEAFYAGMATAIESTPCKCAVCANIEELKLKIIVHSGKAVFSTIAGSLRLSGADVILAHRLLKNSVPSSEYLLLTASAYRDLGAGMEGEFVEGRESYAELGTVTTYVRYLGEVKERYRDELYALSPAQLALRGEGYVLWSLRGQLGALLEQVRHPVAPVSGLRRAGFVLRMMLQAPLMLLLFVFGIPAKLLRQQAARARAAERG